jgi:outer membrane protein
MKNLSLILNILLLLAVGVLYYLHFSGTRSTPGLSESGNVTASDLKIAYINSDSVLKHYEYLSVSKDDLEKKTKKMQQDFQNRLTSLEREVEAYKRNVNNMTLGQVKAVEEDLGKKEQNLRMYQQSLSQQVMEEESKLNKELYDRITVFLKKYGQDKGLQVVLKYDQTSDVLYGGQGLDISQDVIKGLNDLYQQEKSGANPKADSLARK